jgi:hypothetical protein
MCGIQVYMCIYFVDGEKFAYILCRCERGSAIHAYIPTLFSGIHASMDITAYGHITIYRGIPAANTTISLPYYIHPILYQHLYKYSTREYQLIINAVVTSYHNRYPIHMPCPICSYICWNILDCCFICHAAR